MDRKIVWPGQVPLETDLLGTNRNVMVALGRLAQDILGSATLVSGLAASPTTPGSLSITIGAGSLYSLQPIDGTAYSSLPANTTDYVLKQGINATSDATLLTFTPPAVSGQSVIFLVQAAYSEVDTDSVVLPFYNASNPAVPYSGPSNTGASTATTRAGNINIAIKAGVPGASPTPPAADAGFVPLYYVTLAYGQTTITSANIAVAAGAPFLSATLPQIASSAIGLASAAETIAGTITNKAVTPGGLARAIQAGGYQYADDTGAANALVTTLTPAPAAYSAGMTLSVKAAANNTGAATINVNGLGAKAIRFNGAALKAGMIGAGQIYTLVYDGSNFVVINPSTSYQTDGDGNWCRITPDGWVEMGGAYLSLPSSEGGFTLTFPFGGFGGGSGTCLGVTAMIRNTASSTNGMSTIQEVSLTAAAASLFVQNHQTAIADAAGGMRWRAWGRNS